MAQQALHNSYHSLPLREGSEKVFYGLLGYPLGHSFSRTFFNEKFAREGIDAEYLNFELPSIDALPRLLEEHPDLRGLNVTIPHKQAVIPLLDELSDEAAAIGAVNVIRISRDKDGHRHLKGFNSDIIGFTDSIRPFLRPHHRRALVLGTGGASRAVCHGLERLGIEWCYVSRKPQAATCSTVSPSNSSLTYADLTPDVLADYTVIINCTPLGMYPNVDTCPDIPYDALTPKHLLYDLVYNPEETRFLRQGSEHGAAVKGGLEMLHLQALASWNFWLTDK